MNWCSSGFLAVLLSYVLVVCVRSLEGSADSSQKKIEENDQDLISVLVSVRDYIAKSSVDKNADRPPKHNGDPIRVITDVFITDIQDINDESMDFRLDMFILHRWSVPQNTCVLYGNRLRHMGLDLNASLIVPPGHLMLFWIPDTYIMSAKLTDTTSKDGVSKSLRVTRQQTFCAMEYIVRWMSLVTCQLEFSKYPLDIQKCPVSIRSFSYSKDTVLFKWKDDKEIPDHNPDIQLLEYLLTMYKSSSETVMLNTSFSVLSIMMTFERQLAHQMMAVYCPSILIVALSWFSFFMGLDAIPGRVTVCVTCLLSLVTMFAGTRHRLPPVSYANKMDVWMFTCTLFVFTTMMEFTFVKWVDARQKSDKEFKFPTVRIPSPRLPSKHVKRGFQRKMSPRAISLREPGLFRVQAWEMATIPAGKWTGGRVSPADHGQTVVKKEDWAKKTDLLARHIFPVLFIIFNLCYWPVLFLRL